MVCIDLHKLCITEYLITSLLTVAFKDNGHDDQIKCVLANMQSQIIIFVFKCYAASLFASNHHLNYKLAYSTSNNN